MPSFVSRRNEQGPNWFSKEGCLLQFSVILCVSVVKQSLLHTYRATAPDAICAGVSVRFDAGSARNRARFAIASAPLAAGIATA